MIEPMLPTASSLQTRLVDYTVGLLSASETDPYRSTTDIGHIGELKLSDKILVRVTSDTPLSTPFLLHRASYDSYANGSWFPRSGKLTMMSADEPGTTWTLHRGMSPNRRVTIYSRLHRGKGLLALSTGTRLLTDLAVEELKRNRFGTARIEKAAPFVRYTAHFRSGAALMAAPSATDLKIPSTESQAITGLWEKLDGRGRTGEEFVNAISDHFRENFSYSIYQRGRERGKTPIQDFLQRS